MGCRQMCQMWLVVCALLCMTSCTAITPIPVAQLPTRAQQTVVVAGAIVLHDGQVWLAAHVVTMPEVPVQTAETRYAIELDAAQLREIPWRDDGDVRYAPVLVTGVFRDGIVTDVRQIDTKIREQTVANHDVHQLIRFVGHLHTHPDGTYIHDKYKPDMSRGFWPAWVGAEEPIRLAEGAEALIEGVAVDVRIIPIVIAPVIEKTP